MKKICAVLCATVLCGCINIGTKIRPGLLPIPDLDFDESFHSTEYYNNKYSVNIVSASHSIDDELKRAKDSASYCKNCVVKRKIFDKSKKIGRNDYIVGCTKGPLPEKQKENGYCWAAAAQFLIASRFGKHIEQEQIVLRIKNGTHQEQKKQAGSVMEAMAAMGFGGVTFFFKWI